ncbi:UDP-N-acetylglucosamine-1-phosphate transferase, partial [Candidatus Micrarchaeota archaeon]|nr:UDP-N-acetylglucosamine-1-phosphate transferase [Candidatus Micrarchaeota archaeon]
MFSKGYTVVDQYKSDKPRVANIGGIVILAGVIVSVILAQLVLGYSKELIIIYSIVILFFAFGLTDDLININRALKIFIPFFLALPISLVARDTAVWLGFFSINLGAFYLYIIAPVYVMVVSNLINMHSGYNGLAIGLSSILLFFSAIKAYLVKGPESLLLAAPMLGAMIAFWYYDRYPSKIFLGNSGSLPMGAALGVFLIANKLELFGVIALFPHIINFLMYVVWKIKKIGEVKFGKLRSDGTLIVPNNLTLKWFFPYYFRLTEIQATSICYLV